MTHKQLAILLLIVAAAMVCVAVTIAYAQLADASYRHIYEIRVDRLTPTPSPVPMPEPEPTPEYYDVPLEVSLQDYIRERCEELDLDMPLVLAIIDKESGYDPAAVGDDGKSFGLMGVYASEWTELCIELGSWNLLDARQNIRAGTAILAEMLEKYNGLHYALMAYNGGEPYADDLIANGITSTEYTRWVTARAAEIESN